MYDSNFWHLQILYNGSLLRKYCCCFPQVQLCTHNGLPIPTPLLITQMVEIQYLMVHTQVEEALLACRLQLERVTHLTVGSKILDLADLRYQPHIRLLRVELFMQNGPSSHTPTLLIQTREVQ